MDKQPNLGEALVPLDCMVRQMYDGLTAKLDSVFIEAINRAIGKHWAISELKGRVERIKRHGDAFEIVYLDGKPILELHDPVATTEFSEFSAKAVTKQNYRILVEPNEQDEPQERRMSDDI
jgi:hypothetical protein